MLSDGTQRRALPRRFSEEMKIIYIQLLTETKTTANQVSMLRECLDLLPPAHFNCLQYMVQHLHRLDD